MRAQGLVVGLLLVSPLAAFSCEGQPPDEALRLTNSQLDSGADASRDGSGAVIDDAHVVEGGARDGDSSVRGVPDASTNGDAGDAAVSFVYLDSATCPPGTLVHAWNADVCMDLSNDVTDLGPCSMHGINILNNLACEYSYSDGRLASYECQDNDGFTETYAFTYDTTGALAEVHYGSTGDFINDSWSLKLDTNEYSWCDYEAGTCGNRILSDEEAQVLIDQANAVGPFRAPVLDPARVENGQPCTTTGSVAAGSATQVCGTSIFDFGYSQDGTLMMYRVRKPAVDPEYDYRYFFDRAGNLRYVLYQDPIVFPQESRTVVQEYLYDCWHPRCSNQEGDENLLTDGDFETVGVDGFAENWDRFGNKKEGITVDQVAPMCGAASIKMEMIDSWEYWVEQQIVDSPIVAGDHLRASGYYRVDKPYANISIGVGVVLGNGVGWGPLPPPKDANKWIPFSLDLVVPNGASSRLQLWATGPQGGPTTTLWYDDVRVERLP